MYPYISNVTGNEMYIETLSPQGQRLISHKNKHENMY